MKKNYENPLIEIKDQLGIRILATYPNEVMKIDQVIQNHFCVARREDKIELLEHDHLGYLGIHYEVVLPSLINKQTDLNCEDVCEIQLRTKSQDLWASISHELSYKPASASLPDSTTVQRSIYRLIALVELFDKEVSSAQDAILNQPNFPEAKLLKHLETFFYRFTVKDFDRDFSIQNISHLKSILTDEEINNFEDLIGEFVERHNQKLETIFSLYLSDARDTYKILMLFQPEVLLVFERFENNRFALRELWENFLPLELLTFLVEEVWGERLF